MLTVYCDDSGSNYKTPFCVIAGFVAEAGAWRQFSEEWRTELNRLPSLPFLKMSQAYSLKDHFSGWNEAPRERKLERLALIVERYAEFGIGSFVSNAAYKSFVKGYLPQTVDHPYWLCFQGVVMGAISHFSAGGPVNFVFDQQGEGYQRRAHLQMDGLREMAAADSQLRESIGTLSFADGDEEPPLQAAEMLAWSIRDYADSRAQGSPTSRSAAEILWRIPNVTKCWDGAAMEEFVVFIKNITRSVLSTDQTCIVEPLPAET